MTYVICQGLKNINQLVNISGTFTNVLSVWEERGEGEEISCDFIISLIFITSLCSLYSNRTLVIEELYCHNKQTIPLFVEYDFSNKTII